MNRSMIARNASLRGERELLVGGFLIEFRTGAKPESVGDPRGAVVREFAIAASPTEPAHGAMNLIETVARSVGPKGTPGHVRVATSAGETVYELTLGLSNDIKEFDVTMKMATLELVDEQPLELQEFLIVAK